MTDIQAAKRKLEAAQEEYQRAIAQQVADLKAQRDDLDRQIAELEAGTSAPSTGKRRKGIKNDVLATVKANADGIKKADILIAMDAKGDKSFENSISNALTSMKKAGTIAQTPTGLYKAAP
jgi:hypothetical protein